MASLATTAASSLAPFILRRAKWAYVGYGLVAYGALHLARKVGVFGDYPAKAIDFIDTKVKSATGFGGKSEARTVNPV